MHTKIYKKNLGSVSWDPAQTNLPGKNTPAGFYNYWQQNWEQRHVRFPLETQKHDISHGRMARYKSYSSPAVCKPTSTSLRSTYQQVLFFLAEDGLEASKVIVSSVPLTPTGSPDRSASLVLTTFDFRSSKFFSQSNSLLRFMEL